MLLTAVVVIVVAPSVDLEPTILRGGHHFDRVLTLVAAASFASAFGSDPQAPLPSRFWPPVHSIFSANDLVVLVSTLRC